jgi:hypothetical protein
MCAAPNKYVIDRTTAFTKNLTRSEYWAGLRWLVDKHWRHEVRCGGSDQAILVRMGEWDGRRCRCNRTHTS